MRVFCILLAALCAISFTAVAQADCGCKAKKSCQSCGCHKSQCGGDVQLLPDAPQEDFALPGDECCPQAQYTLCCGHEDYKLLCDAKPCVEKPKCANKCGCDKCERCAHKTCGCGKCRARAKRDPVRD